MAGLLSQVVGLQGNSASEGHAERDQVQKALQMPQFLITYRRKKNRTLKGKGNRK